MKGRASVQHLRPPRFQVSGPRILNSMPKNRITMKDCSLNDLKNKLDAFLRKEPDEPKSQSLIPVVFM